MKIVCEFNKEDYKLLTHCISKIFHTVDNIPPCGWNDEYDDIYDCIQTIQNFFEEI